MYNAMSIWISVRMRRVNLKLFIWEYNQLHNVVIAKINKTCQHIEAMHYSSNVLIFSTNVFATNVSVSYYLIFPTKKMNYVYMLIITILKYSDTYGIHTHIHTLYSIVSTHTHTIRTICVYICICVRR